MTATITKGQIGEEDIIHFDGTGTNTFNRLTSSGGTLTLNKVGSEVDALIVYGGGVNYTNATIASALSAIGTSTKATLLIRPGTWTISSNVDWSAYTNVKFEFAKGATISHSTYTVKIPDFTGSPLFTGTGLVSFVKARSINPKVFTENATPGTTLMGGAINKAAASLINGGIVELDPEEYAIGTTSITIPTNVSLVGVAGKTKLSTTATTNFNMLLLDSVSGVAVKNIYFSGSAVTDSASPVRAIYLHRSSDCEIHSNTFEGLNYGVHLSDDSGIAATNPRRNKIHHNTFKNAIGDSNGGYGLLHVYSLESEIDHNIFSPGPYGRHAIYLSVGTRKSVVQGNLIINSRLGGLAMNTGTSAGAEISDNSIIGNTIVGQGSSLANSHAITGTGNLLRNTISANIVVDSSYSGIFLQAANATIYPTYNKIIGNTVFNSADVGIILDDGMYNHIIGNTIYDTQGVNDIVIDQTQVAGGGQYNVVESNIFKSHGTDPVSYHCTMASGTANNTYKNNTRLDAVPHENDSGTNNIWNYELYGTVTWDPADLADWAGETSPDITVTGAIIGMSVAVYPPYNLQGMSVSAHFKTTDTVVIRIDNNTGGNINLGSGVWKVRVFK